MDACDKYFGVFHLPGFPQYVTNLLYYQISPLEKPLAAFLRIQNDAVQNEKWTSVTGEAEEQLERLDQCID